jgi:glutamate--cysteine ligase
MPEPARSLTCDDAVEMIGGWCDGDGDRQVGLELEWLTVTGRDDDQPSWDVLEAAGAAALPLPSGGRLSFEPGGQLEVSTPPLAGVDECIAAAAADAAHVEAAFGAFGVDLLAVGGPTRARRRLVDTARYRAMESYFTRLGPPGPAMMRATASLQVNLDLGPPGVAAARWRLAHAVGPTLVAAFANSPGLSGPASYRSTRMAVWRSIDSTRTAPVPGADPLTSWAEYALAANVMFVQTGVDDFFALDRAMSLRRWIEVGHDLGYPTSDDVAYHLTTLFPPVRLRGWIELRMLDALPAGLWQAAVAVVFALMRDHASIDATFDAVAGTEHLWREAVEVGVSHPDLAGSARRCLAIALETLERDGAAATTSDAVAAFADHYTLRGRAPADDVVPWRVPATTVRVGDIAWT